MFYISSLAPLQEFERNIAPFPSIGHFAQLATFTLHRASPCTKESLLAANTTIHGWVGLLAREMMVFA
jgi:hypothetical protein